MTKHQNRWKAIRKKKRFAVPFKKVYCVCGKLSFTSAREAERYRLRELVDRGSKRRSHVYECPESHHYHITYEK